MNVLHDVYFKCGGVFPNLPENTYSLVHNINNFFFSAVITLSKIHNLQFFDFFFMFINLLNSENIIFANIALIHWLILDSMHFIILLPFRIYSNVKRIFIIIKPIYFFFIYTHSFFEYLIQLNMLKI